MTSQQPAPDASLPVILSVAFPYAPIGQRAVGGAEVICSHLEASLNSLGFRSVVVAHADSTPAGRLYGTKIPSGTITDALRAQVEAAQQRNMDLAFADFPVSLVHMHGLDFHRYRVPADIPVLVTLHLPPSWYPETIWSLPASYHFLCVSETERNACPPHVQDRIAVIPNGVPLADPATHCFQGRFALMLSRICPEKNLHTGLDAARLAAMPVLLGGEVFPYEAHQRYFERVLQPRLTHTGTAHQQHAARAQPIPDRPPARFLGPIFGSERARLLKRAACLIQPSLAPETSCLVAMEALAAGTPVIAMAVGAIPEIVDHGRTGFLIRPGPTATQHMAEAIRNLAQIDRHACRSEAEARFGLDRMLNAYCQLYQRLARATRSPSATPVIQPEISKDAVVSFIEQSYGAISGPPISATSPAPLQITRLTSTVALNALVPEWTDLWSQDSQATPFQHPAWLLPWWHHFGPDGELQTLVLRDHNTGDLVAVLPLYTYRHPHAHQRQLLLIGAGTSDYLDGLWSPSAPKASAEALLHAAQKLPNWDTASLSQLRPASPLAQAAKDLGLTLTPAQPCSTLDTTVTLPAKLRANINRYHRRAELEGDLRCHIVATTEEAHVAFDHLVRLHTGRWQARGEPGVLADPRVLAHHREALPLLLEANLLRLFHLTLSGETLGVLYTLADAPHVFDRHLLCYLISFDARFAHLSPGTLLTHAAWQQAQTEGLTTLDFLRGNESYKTFWGAISYPTLQITAVQGSTNERLPNPQSNDSSPLS